MSIINYDCGELSSVVLSTNVAEGYYVPVEVTLGGVTGNVYLTYPDSMVSFFCSGEMIVDNFSDFAQVLISPVTFQSAWSENLLMGLAGVICASLLAYVFVKYAV